MEENMIYKCQGTCGGISVTPGFCQAEDCTRHGKPLTKHCQCEECSKKRQQTAELCSCDKCQAVE